MTIGWARWRLERGRSWWSIIRLVPLAGRVAVAALVLNLVIGLLPLGFIVGTSVAIYRVAAVGRPLGASGRWVGVLVAAGLAVASLLAQSALSPFQAAFGELISRRVDGACARRLMRSTLADASFALLEQPEVVAKLGDARRGLAENLTTPGAAVAGLLTLIARYTQLVGAVVILGVVLGPLAGLLIAAVAVIARFGNRSSLARWSLIVSGMSAARRKMYYVFDTGSAMAAAKEIRVLGTLPWWRARADREAAAYLDPLWRDRRRIFLAPFVVFSLAALAGTAAVLVMFRDVADHGGLSVLGISLAIQAILIPLRFGVFFPEADVQTQYGMQAHDSILEIERDAAAGAGRLRPGAARSGRSPPPASGSSR